MAVCILIVQEDRGVYAFETDPVEQLTTLRSQLNDLISAARERKMQVAKEYSLLSKWHELTWGGGGGGSSRSDSKRKMSHAGIGDHGGASGAGAAVEGEPGTGGGAGGSGTGSQNKRRASEVKVKLSGTVGDTPKESKSKGQSERKKSKSKSDSKKGDGITAADFARPPLQAPAEHPFWADVDGHLREPLQAQVEQLVQVGRNIAELSPQLKYVPTRGSLYEERWQEEDFLQMHADSAAAAAATHMHSSGGGYVNQPGLASGEVTDWVTQRMLSALVGDDAGLRERIGMPSATAEMQQAAQGISPKVSQQALEKELRRCVVTLGLLDGPEKVEEDKVMMQLQHQQHTLKLQNLNISAKFMQLHSKISSMSATERSREEQQWVRRETQYDAEVEDCYHRRQVYVRRNQPPPPELEEKIKSALARRTAFLSGKPVN